jgi:DNA topoisomerase IB
MSPRLRRADCSAPGLTRRKAGKGFTYLDSDGERVTEPEDVERIAELGIPPAWKDVWICPDQDGHLQATGSTRPGASSTSTTRSGARGGTPRSSTR